MSHGQNISEKRKEKKIYILLLQKVQGEERNTKERDDVYANRRRSRFRG